MYTEKDINTLEQAGLQAVNFGALPKSTLNTMCTHLKSNIETDILLKASEVARLMNVSKMTVSRYIKAGKINTVDFFGNVRIKRSEIDKILSGQ